MNCSKLVFVVTLLTFQISAMAQDRPDLRVGRAEKAPSIDGSLNDEAWREASPLPSGDFLSYDPLYGQKQEQRTEIRVTYDDRYLYFAFHCLDSEPGKIRTTIARRDNVFNDDWVGLSLDSGGNGQTSHHMMVNPSGIQMDALNTSASGERWDSDFVWESAGKVTEDGYAVEIRLPLQSIRFKGGDEVKMGILFWRRISRLGVSAAWPDIPPGQWVFKRRAANGQWSDSEKKGDAGLSAKYGITSCSWRAMVSRRSPTRWI